MIDEILHDGMQLPRVFLWRGPLNPKLVDEWISPNRVHIPRDLKELWIATGGGDIFETETILCPLTTDPEYDIMEVNQLYWKSGVDKNLLIFHIGTWVSAVRNDAPKFVSWSTEDTKNMMQFDSLSAWYCQTLRKEYGQRYGLAHLG